MKTFLFAALCLVGITSCKDKEPVEPIVDKPTSYKAEFYAYTHELKTIELSITNDTQKILIKRSFDGTLNHWDTSIVLKPGANGYFLAKDYYMRNASRFLVVGKDTLSKFIDMHTFQLPK